MEARLENASWRKWYQKKYNLKTIVRPPSTSEATSGSPPKPKKQVSFNDNVQEFILPPLQDQYTEEDPEYPEEEGIIECMGKNLLAVLVAVSSFMPQFSMKFPYLAKE